ncbi:MAG: TIGR02687 family protein [Deltaproteobacteria bacterium RIFOXYD12_FULL_50_9]|nr:MAG: TIGR02687 family protein [Deltaproteobacteria bacterium RIFOXYD12_FULL_50_9]
MDKITQAVSKIFERHRIVFWYDKDKELRADFEALDLTDIEKIELQNNEFQIKYHILRENPKQRFLLYHEGPQPEPLNNWLLDVLLSQGEFCTDQASLYLSELELGPEFADLVRNHLEFFNAIKRREALKNLATKNDTHNHIRLNMMAVCAGSDPRIDSILENLLSELASERQDKFNLLAKCGLESFLWEQLNRHYGYTSETKSILDFVIEMFKSCFGMELGKTATLSGDAVIFLRRWKDSIRHCPAFEYFSEYCADILAVEQDLLKCDFKGLQGIDYFRLIDKKIISDLVRSVANRTISAGECAMIVRNRRQSHWYKEFHHLYEAVEFAAHFIHTLNELDMRMDSLANGIDRYSGSWYRLDQLYRKFIYHSRKSGMISLLELLATQIEDLYNNNFLLQVNDSWQKIVDTPQNWSAISHVHQKQFYEKHIKPFLVKNKKVFVIVSDALRFEIGDELLSLIRQEDRYDAELLPMLGMLPSFTQLGMAALLPNTRICFAEKSTNVLVDEMSTLGTANRSKILDKALPGRAKAMRAEELLGLNKDDSRNLFRDNDLVYVYHNRIDATGDKKESEERVFEAVEETIQELIKVIKKLTGANVTNMVITSDHGFIYQNRPIDDSDFTDVGANGDEIYHQDRRFILGKGLTPQKSLRHFKSEELGLAGDVEIQIPKSINRLRLKGSGSRYVHGGASLQELIIPVLKINKKRQSDVANVNVDILRSGSSIITSGQVSVAFYQTEPATDKIRPRILRAGIYTKDGEPVSDCHELIFDYISENPREREIQIRFLMTKKADEANGQDVILRLDEPLPGTAQIREYKSVIYTLRRSFTSDFD